jgi:hypothetical protein
MRVSSSGIENVKLDLGEKVAVGDAGQLLSWGCGPRGVLFGRIGFLVPFRVVL